MFYMLAVLFMGYFCTPLKLYCQCIIPCSLLYTDREPRYAFHKQEVINGHWEMYIWALGRTRSAIALISQTILITCRVGRARDNNDITFPLSGFAVSLGVCVRVFGSVCPESSASGSRFCMLGAHRYRYYNTQLHNTHTHTETHAHDALHMWFAAVQ